MNKKHFSVECLRSRALTSDCVSTTSRAMTCSVGPFKSPSRERYLRSRARAAQESTQVWTCTPLFLTVRSIAGTVLGLSSAAEGKKRMKRKDKRKSESETTPSNKRDRALGCHTVLANSTAARFRVVFRWGAKTRTKRHRAANLEQNVTGLMFRWGSPKCMAYNTRLAHHRLSLSSGNGVFSLQPTKKIAREFCASLVNAIFRLNIRLQLYHFSGLKKAANHVPCTGLVCLNAVKLLAEK